MTKHERAVELADEGGSNTQIITALNKEFGEGIATTKLAEIRATKPERQRAAIEAMRVAKRELCRKMLLSGCSGYSIQKECKEAFGTGLGYEIIQDVKAELGMGPSPAEVGTPGLVEPVELPPDLYTDPEDLLESETALAVSEPEVALVVTAPPGPNGTLDNMKAIQQWMVSINAESLSLTRDGNLSVLARHDFCIGGLA